MKKIYIEIPNTVNMSDAELDEVAKMMMFLVTDATFSTGTEFVIDGGFTAR